MGGRVGFGGVGEVDHLWARAMGLSVGGPTEDRKSESRGRDSSEYMRWKEDTGVSGFLAHGRESLIGRRR